MTPVRTVRIDFSLDEPFEETTIDLRTVESVYSLELSEDGNEVVLINLQVIFGHVLQSLEANVLHGFSTCDRLTRGAEGPGSRGGCMAKRTGTSCTSS